MREIIVQWIWLTAILAVYVFSFIALLFKVGDMIDKWRANRRKK